MVFSVQRLQASSLSAHGTRLHLRVIASFSFSTPSFWIQVVMPNSHWELSECEFGTTLNALMRELHTQSTSPASPSNQNENQTSYAKCFVIGIFLFGRGRHRERAVCVAAVKITLVGFWKNANSETRGEQSAKIEKKRKKKKPNRVRLVRVQWKVHWKIESKKK